MRFDGGNAVRRTVKLNIRLNRWKTEKYRLRTHRFYRIFITESRAVAESATKGTRETAVLRAAEKSSVAFLVFEFEPKSFDFILLFLSFLRFLGDVKADGAAYRYKGF